MKCPSCETELVAKRYHDLVVDVCSGCKGMWFDAGEMKEFIEHLLEDREEIPNARIQLDKPIMTVDGLAEAARRCPHCNERMTKINYAYDSNIILDRCLSCEGLWADGDELLALAMYKKGNPKLERLGKAVLQHREEMRELAEAGEAAEALKGNLGLTAFVPKLVIPLGVERIGDRFPAVVLTLIAVNALAFLLASATDAYRLGWVPSQTWSVEGLGSVFSGMFLHGDFLHLLVNMFFLWLFGPSVEDELGHVRFALFYIIFGIAADAAHAYTCIDPSVPVIGSSGAISGVMGACYILCRRAKVRTLFIRATIDLPAWVFLAGWFVFQILYATMYLATTTRTDIAWFAHVGGFVAGLAVGWVHQMLTSRRSEREDS